MYNNEHIDNSGMFQTTPMSTPRPPIFGSGFTRSTSGTAPMLATTYSLGDLGIE